MPINLDNLKRVTDITIEIAASLLPRRITVCFSRYPDSEVFSYLKGFERMPGFNVYNGIHELQYDIWIPSELLLQEIAEQIAQGFERDHSLKVCRLVDNSKLGEKTPSLGVSSFI